MTLVESLVLGVVQGVTEFLPVSSSGHLVLMQHTMGLQEDMLVFDIFVHFGTLLAVLVVFRDSIGDLVFDGWSGLKQYGPHHPRMMYERHPGVRTLTAIVAGTLPAVVVGLFFKDAIERHLLGVDSVMVALAATGVLLVGTLFVRRGTGTVAVATGLVIGIAQALAVIPGISRSGATIACALYLGIDRDRAGEFSFLLAIPAIAGATLLAVLDLRGQPLATIPFLPYGVGMAAAFLVGWGALLLLLHMIRRGAIGHFGWYCFLLAAAIYYFR